MTSPNSERGPRQPAPAPPTQLRRSLALFPTELLRPIAEALVPTPPLTTRFALRVTGTWEFRDADHQWADWLASRRNLLSFAQTSRRFAAIAKPLLYHTIVIPTPRVLVSLAVLIENCPAIRPWIRNIACFVNVAGFLTIADVHRELTKQDCVRFRPSYEDPPSVIGAMNLLRGILVRAPNLEDFLLAPPDLPLGSREPADVASPVLQHVISHAWAGENGRFHEPLFEYFPFRSMRNLTSLRIYCHREDGDRQLTLTRLIADYAATSLPLLTQLRTLEVCCAAADDVLQPSHPPRDIPPLPHIEHLRLYGSHIHEPRLVALCLACVNLQTLVVHFEASTTDDDRPLLPEGKTLNDALAGLAHSLRTLELVSLSEGHYLTRGTERPRKPENHRLRCIPALTRLETLTLDYRGVFGTLGILDEDDGERLCQLLPPSVRDFTLVCEWGTARDWKQTYLANLDMVLHGVECLCASKAHRLASISLAIHSWPAESRFHRRFRREVETARQRCARAGILFRTFDLLPSYQDEDEVPGAEDDEVFEDGDEDAVDGAVGYDQFGHIPSEEELELEEEDEASEYYFSGDDDSDPERQARRPPTFNDFLQALGEDHGHSLDELFYAYHEDRWDEYLF